MRIAMLLHKSVEFDSRVRREASALAEAGHDLTVLELAAVPDGATLDGFKRKSVLPSPGLRRRLPFHIYRVAFLVLFVAGIVRLRPRVVHAHDAAMLLPGVLGARLTGARLVYDSHELATGVPYRGRTWGRLVGLIERLVVPRSAAVITVSDGIAARLRDRYRLATPPVVVRNVSALARTGDGGLRQTLGLDPDDPLVLHQGAPAPDRGCELLVDAVAQLEGVHLVFLGDPEAGYQRQLEARINRRDVADRVALLPSVPLDELLAHTAEADVGVTLLQDTCENHRLALPNKLFEYIAAGIPVIASALPETERLIDRYGIGWCVRPGARDALTAALEHALQARGDPALQERLARATRELRWSHEQVHLTSLYRQLDGCEQAGSEPTALLLVRNSVSHDSRVLRAARTASSSLKGRVVVLGVQGENAPTEERASPGVTIRRVRHPRRRGSASPGPASPGAAASVPPEQAKGPDSTFQRLPPRTRLRRIAVGGIFVIHAILLARKLRPAVVHANDWNTMWAGILVKLAFGSGLVYDSHELWADRNGRWEFRPWLLLCEALFVQIADQVVTTSPGHARALARRYRIDTPLVVRNLPEWSATDEPPVSDPPCVVYLGGLMPGRGIEQMIDALPLLEQVRLRAVGHGRPDYRSRLVARAKAAGVADRIELVAPVPPDAVASEIAGSAIGLCLIQPICRSYELSLPNKLLEYAAAHVPILASDLPVIGPVVRDNALGVVVNATEPAAVAVGVRSLLDPLVRGQAVAAARRFSSTNTWVDESRLLASTYLSVAKQTGGAVRP
jgi:glycosyltransferase involved in cell wall biosynthesis